MSETTPEDMGVHVTAVACIRTKEAEFTLVVTRLASQQYSMGLVHCLAGRAVMTTAFGRAEAPNDVELITGLKNKIIAGELPGVTGGKEAILGWSLEEVNSSFESVLNTATEKLESKGFRYMVPDFDKPWGVVDNPFLSKDKV